MPRKMFINFIATPADDDDNSGIMKSNTRLGKDSMLFANLSNKFNSSHTLHFDAIISSRFCKLLFIFMNNKFSHLRSHYNTPRSL